MTRDETILNHLAPLAIAAGMVDDADAVKLLDTSEISIAHDGSVVLPYHYFDGQRRAKPFMFKGGNQPHIRKDFQARTASAEDYAAAKRAYVSSVGRR